MRRRLRLAVPTLVAISAAACFGEPATVSGKWSGTVALDSATYITLSVKRSDSVADGMGNYTPLRRTQSSRASFFVYGHISGNQVKLRLAPADDDADVYGEAEFRGTLSRRSEDVEQITGVIDGGRFHRLPLTLEKRRWR